MPDDVARNSVCLILSFATSHASGHYALRSISIGVTWTTPKINEILTARRDGILVGYAIFSEEPNGGGVADLCAVEEQAVIARLLAGVVEILRRRGAASVSLRAGDSHPWNRVFERAGFRRREETPLVLHVLSNRLQRLKQQACWHLMQGERDS